MDALPNHPAVQADLLPFAAAIVPAIASRAMWRRPIADAFLSG
jgi:hypothetical protein